METSIKKLLLVISKPSVKHFHFTKKLLDMLCARQVKFDRRDALPLIQIVFSSSFDCARLNMLVPFCSMQRAKLRN